MELDTSDTERLHFVPTSPAGELNLLSEACTLAITGKRSWDSHIWIGDGVQRISIPAANEAKAQEMIMRFAIGYRAIAEGLEAADLSAIVQSKDSRAFFRVPRFYWFQVRPDDGDHLPLVHDEIPADLLGQPLLVDEAKADKWRELVERAASRLMGGKEGTNGAGDETPRASVSKTPSPKRRGSRPGQKKRPAQLRGILLPIFRRYHEELSDMSRSEKLAFVKKFWSDRSVPICTDKTVETHWNEYVDRRASEVIG